MNLSFENSKIKGKVVLSDSLHESPALLKDKSLYKFIWVLSGRLELDVDHQSVVLEAGQLMTLSHLHHLEFVRVEGEYLSLLFNGNFYCIHGNDHEVSCNGLLFHGSSHVVIFDLSDDERRKIDTLTGIMREEFESRDHLQEEMLRVLLKRFIILCTRIVGNRQGMRQENSMQFETIRKFYVLVDTWFKEKKQVQEYADMLNKSPKTLANLHLPAALCHTHHPQPHSGRSRTPVTLLLQKLQRDRPDAGLRRPGHLQPLLQERNRNECNRVQEEE